VLSLQQSTEESNWQCLPSNEQSTNEITSSNQLHVFTDQGFSCTDGCLDSEPTYFDSEVSLISPLPPPYSPVENTDSSKRILSFKLVGDNIDKDVNPRHMHVYHQTRSLNYFNTFAVQDRIPTFDLPEQCVDHLSLTMHDFLPSAEDYTKLQSHFTFLVSRIMCSDMEYFNKLFGKCLTYHIQLR